MEIGEPVCVPVAGTADAVKEWKFRAEILEVTFKSDIQVTRDQQEISPPHWKKGEDVKDVWSEAKKMGLPQDAAYSKKAAVMLIRDAPGAKQDVEVKINVIESENVSGEGNLLGRIGDMEITGKFPLGAGQHTLTAQIKTLPDRVSWYRGAINWGGSITDPGVSIALGDTNVEVFFLPAAPVVPFASGVWAEALRFLCTRAGVVGEKTPQKIAERITYYCHKQHGLEYDTVDGAARYTTPRLQRFELNKYMKAEYFECNCYDQASSVQVFSAALGVNVQWLFMPYFGFIHTTDLVGVGNCNNPFFRSNGSDKIVSSRDAKRTAFNNHAFCDLNGKILDACAGPELGTKSRRGYLDATIDYDPALYPDPAEHAGRIEDLREFLPMIKIR